MIADRKESTAGNEDSDQKTLKPSKSPVISTVSLPKENRPEAPRSVSDSYAEDYSDLATEEDETGLKSKLANLKVNMPFWGIY